MAYPDQSVFTGTDPLGLWFPLLETSTRTWYIVETNGRSFVDMYLGHPGTYPATWNAALQQMLQRAAPRWPVVSADNLFPSMARTVAARAGQSILSWELNLAQRAGANAAFVIPETFWWTNRSIPPYSGMVIENVPFRFRYRQLERPWNASGMPGLENVSDTDAPPANDISTSAAPTARPRTDFIILGTVSLATAVVSYLAFRRLL